MYVDVKVGSIIDQKTNTGVVHIATVVWIDDKGGTIEEQMQVPATEDGWNQALKSRMNQLNAVNPVVGTIVTDKSIDLSAVPNPDDPTRMAWVQAVRDLSRYQRLVEMGVTEATADRDAALKAVRASYSSDFAKSVLV